MEFSIPFMFSVMILYVVPIGGDSHRVLLVGFVPCFAAVPGSQGRFVPIYLYFLVRPILDSGAVIVASSLVESPSLLGSNQRPYDL